MRFGFTFLAVMPNELYSSGLDLSDLMVADLMVAGQRAAGGAVSDDSAGPCPEATIKKLDSLWTSPHPHGLIAEFLREPLIIPCWKHAKSLPWVISNAKDYDRAKSFGLGCEMWPLKWIEAALCSNVGPKIREWEARQPVLTPAAAVGRHPIISSHMSSDPLKVAYDAYISSPISKDAFIDRAMSLLEVKGLESDDPVSIEAVAKAFNSLIQEGNTAVLSSNNKWLRLGVRWMLESRKTRAVLSPTNPTAPTCGYLHKKAQLEAGSIDKYTGCMEICVAEFKKADDETRDKLRESALGDALFARVESEASRKAESSDSRYS